MFLSVIVIATDGSFTPSYGAVYGVFVACVLLHGVLASTLQRIMGKSQGTLVWNYESMLTLTTQENSKLSL